MKYKLIIQPSALADLEEAYRWIVERSPTRATGWFNRFVDALTSLETHPERCETAPESKFIGVKIRQLLYGRRGGIYRALYTIRGRDVHILHIRHAAREYMTPEEFYSRQ
jgi:plasmid stabilization system protein ParE